jgi:hypothetical protein
MDDNPVRTRFAIPAMAADVGRRSPDAAFDYGRNPGDRNK